MRLTLKPHPDSRCTAPASIEAEAARRAGRLLLSYAAAGGTDALRLPPVAACERADELWQTTCFEAFLRAAPDGPYYEFNFAPSTQWAAYRFDAYRSGMRAVEGIAPPRIEVQAHAGRFELRVALALDGLADLAAEADWRLGLCAVIEDRRGRKSWWALAHPPGRPDFHHSDCFVQELPAA